MQVSEACAFLPRNGDDFFSRKTPMRVWCKEFQYIFASAMFFLSKKCTFAKIKQKYSSKTNVLQIFMIFGGWLFRARGSRSAHLEQRFPTNFLSADASLLTKKRFSYRKAIFTQQNQWFCCWYCFRRASSLRSQSRCALQMKSQYMSSTERCPFFSHLSVFQLKSHSISMQFHAIHFHSRSSYLQGGAPQ